MRARCVTLLGGLVLALGLAFVSSGVAAAAPTSNVHFNGQRIHASGGETSGSSRSVCVVLWRGVPIPFRGFNWSPVASRCGDRPSSRAITGVSTPAINCYPAHYYSRTTTYSGTGGSGSQVGTKASPLYSTGC